MMRSPFSARRFRLIFIIGWLAMIADQAMIIHFFGQDWRTAVTDSVISNSILLLFTLLVMNTLRYYLPRGTQYINIFFLCLVLAFLWLLLTRWVLSLTLGWDEDYRPLIDPHALSVRYSIAFLLLGCITMISVVWYNQQEFKEQETRKADAEKLSREAELFKLRQQLQPHFLFNSLNSINALIGSRPEEARKMVQQLSDFLRGTLKKEETQWVSLKEELQYLQLYLDIEKVRFGNRLETVIDVKGNCLDCSLPALLLQPIMENAIKFGLYDTTGQTTIRLIAEKTDHELQVSIINPFDPETSSPQKGTGFGLKSVQRRLYLLFGRTDLLQTLAEGNIFTTRLRIPQLAASKENV